MSHVVVGPDRVPVTVLTSPGEDEVAWTDAPAFADSYGRFGWAVGRGLIPAAACDAVREAFARSVKPFPGPLLRQTTTRRQPHKLSRDDHYMVNALLSVQDMTEPEFADFRRAGLHVLTHPNVLGRLEALLGDRCVVVESMYFESSKGTPAHMDRHFMDSTVPGTMVGAWFALEDIHAEAGRFFVAPRSHLLGTDAADLASLRETYAEYEALRLATSTTFSTAGGFTNGAALVDMARLKQKLLDPAVLPLRAPALSKGDVLFWAAGTMHGSVAPTARGRSRHSLTAHYVARSHGYQQYGVPCPLDLVDIDGTPVHHRGPGR